jgi:hypothetical protein
MSKAKEIIRESIERLAASDAPDTLRPFLAGEINMAKKLDLISYAERDHLMGNLKAACARRRDELHSAKLKRLGIKQ